MVKKQILNKINTITTTQVLYTSLLISFFLLGYFYAKTEFLQSSKTGTTLVANTNTAPVISAAPQPAQPSFTKDNVKTWAGQIGLDKNKFSTCLDSQKYKSDVEKDSSEASKVGAQGTPTFFINGVKVVGALPFDSFKTKIDQFLNGETVEGEVVEVSTGNLPVLGNKNATVEIIEFVDLECPYCQNFAAQTLPQLKKEYIDTGKVAFYIRHLPLPFHPMSGTFAQAVECANDEDKAWEMHDKIIQEQSPN